MQQAYHNINVIANISL